MSRGDVVDVWIGPPEIQRWRQSSKCSKWSYRSSALGANFVNDSENELRTGGARGVRCDATKFPALKSSSVELWRAIWCATGIKSPGE